MDVGAVPMNSVELQTWLREKEGNQPARSKWFGGSRDLVKKECRVDPDDPAGKKFECVE
jgi:hypothetical protein